MFGTLSFDLYPCEAEFLQQVFVHATDAHLEQLCEGQVFAILAAHLKEHGLEKAQLEVVRESRFYVLSL